MNPARSRLFTITGAVLFVIGAAVAIVPYFAKCNEPMAACVTTAKWEIVVGAGIAVLAVLVIAATRSWVRLIAAGGATALAALSIALPTAITGLCSDPMMRCQVYFRPSSIILGVVGLIVGAGILGITVARQRSSEESARRAA
jgi:hypothetical protein